MKSRIMYIENKGEGITGEGRIGRVTFSKSGKSVYYGGRRFETLAGRGFKATILMWKLASIIGSPAVNGMETIVYTQVQLQ